MALEEEGTIISVDGEQAVVAVVSHGGCESCPSASVCGGEGERRSVTAMNPVHARPGDRVKIVMHAKMYIKGTMIVYGVPAVLLIAGAMLGKTYADARMPGTDPDMVAAGAGFTLFIAAFIGAKLWSHRVEKSDKYIPVIEKIL